MPIFKPQSLLAVLRNKSILFGLMGLLLATPQSKGEEQVFYSNGEMSVFFDRDAELRTIIYWPGSEPGSTAGRARFVLEDISSLKGSKVLINEVLKIHYDTAYPERSFLYFGNFYEPLFKVHLWRGKGGDQSGLSLVFMQAQLAESIGFRAGRDYSGFDFVRGPSQVPMPLGCDGLIR